MSAATPEPRRRPGRPPRAVSGPRIEARLLAAMERLLAQGTPFAAVSVEALVAEAGIARATFYTHFKDKPALVARWLSRISDDVVASGGEWFEGDGPVSPGQVKTALMGIVAAFGRHQAIFAAVAATAPFDTEVAALHHDMMSRLCEASRRGVRRAQAQGTATPLADDAMADLLTWLIELYCSRFVAQMNDAERTRTVERLAHICARAIFVDAVPAQGARSKRSLKP